MTRHRSKAALSRLIRIDEQGCIVAPRVFPLVRRNMSSLFAETSLVRQLGGYDEVPVGADTALVWRMTKQIGDRRLLRLDQVDTLATHRFDSLTVNHETGMLSESGLRQRVAIHEATMFELLRPGF